jgi:poly-gamma-glutamate synthesis protein (capsule biosynthesis protein)
MRSPVALVVLLAACSGGGAPEQSPAPTAAGPTAPTAPPADPQAAATPPADAAPAAPPIDAPPPVAERIELTFMGDIIFGGRFNEKWFPMDVPKNDPLALVAPYFQSDLPLANLETTILDEIPDVTGSKRFFATPDQLAILPRHGLTAVTIANNHVNDYDLPGLPMTLGHLADAGMTVVGAPRDDNDGFGVDTIDVKGWKIGVVAGTARLNRRQKKKDRPRIPFAFDEKLPPKIQPLVEQARADHDLVIVILHWGAEYTDIPMKWQIDAAHAFVDAGADAVIGHHAHVLQPIERYKHGVIAYSLGNFLFQNGEPKVRDTGVLRLGFSRAGDRPCLDLLAFHPAITRRQPYYHPEPVTGDEAEEVVERVTRLSKKKPFKTAWTVEGDRMVAPAACGESPAQGD